MNSRSVASLKNIRNKRVLVRLDLNVPVVDGEVLDDYRIQTALPTLSLLQKKGAKIIAISHFGEKKESLKDVVRYMAKKIKKVSFVPYVTHPRVTQAIEHMKAGDIIVLENIRLDEGEKKNTPIFAKTLASYGDIYVNEAFSASHRKHASIVGIPEYIPGFAGLQLAKEIKELSKLLKPKKPFLFILGGAKFGTKLPLLQKYFSKADHIFVGGALANNLLKARGFEVGLSVIDTDTVIPKKITQAKKIIHPEDALLENGDIRTIEDIAFRDKMFDIGPVTVAKLQILIEKASTILLNGPLGNYELGFRGGTEAILSFIAKSKGYSVVGGGDTVALVREKKFEKQISFTSTGGGAMLDFLAFGTLPGIQALHKKPRHK